MVSPVQCHPVSLFRPVTPVTAIATQFATDGRLIHTHDGGDFSLVMTHFQQGINLVSLFPGELSVGSHKCSFELAVEEALILSGPLVDHSIGGDLPGWVPRRYR